MKTEKNLKQEFYDRFYRDQESRKFYKSEVWQKTGEMKLSRDPLCETCQQSGHVLAATMVHHMFPVKKGTKNLDLNFLVSMCLDCHHAVEAEMKMEGKTDG